jgi:ketosteroid isomerase-like protein
MLARMSPIPLLVCACLLWASLACQAPLTPEPAPGEPRPTAAAEQAIMARLEAFHRAAERADFEAYFEVLSADSVFIGTDASERWSKAQFADYTRPFFERGQGWTYRTVERHVSVGAGGQWAYFDERLDNPKYGAARGSGALRLEPDGQWRLVHYVLSFPIPNDLAGDITSRIRAAGG